MYPIEEEPKIADPILLGDIQKRHKVGNLFAKLKDWRRIAMRYDRCAHTFRSVIYIAATLIFWL